MTGVASPAQSLHREAVVFDATCPLLNDPDYIDAWIQGGCTAAAPTVASNDDAPAALAKVGRWLRRIDEDPRLLHVTRVEHFAQAKAEGRLGIVFHFQNSVPLGRDVDNVWAYAALGVRVIQLTYNTRNFVGDGCDDRTDAGLSDFGVRVIRAMNRAGIVVDLSHTGVRTTLEAMEVTEATPVFSHSNARGVHPSPRNLTDEQIRRVAELGGVIGLNAFPAFISTKPQPTLDDLVDHAAYIADLVGAEHIGLGLDFYSGMAGVADPARAQAEYEALVAAGTWKPAVYPPPPYHYPQGLESPAGLPAVTERLLARGFSPAEVRGILGGNFLRVFEAVWR